MLNNSQETIYAGDELWWDPPRKDADGRATGYIARPTAPKKIPAYIVRRYDPTVHAPDSRDQFTDLWNSGVLQPHQASVSGSNSSPASVLFDTLVRLHVLSSNAGGQNKAAAINAVNDLSTRRSVYDALLTVPKDNANRDFNRLFVSGEGGMLATFMAACSTHIGFITSRKFAKATSTAGPGEQVDVVYGGYRH